jgi:epoxide hydrolase-like predicted phosphatase
MREIEAIIFDWGGVLIDDPRPGLLRYCADTFGVSQELYTPVHDSFLDEFGKGMISEDEFWQGTSRKLGRPAKCKAGKPVPEVPSLWSRAFRSACVPRPEVFRLVSSLHAKGYKTALLSNTELPAVEFFHEFGYDMFDALVFSCEQGVAKPEPRIYEITLEKLGSKAARSVFIDDRQEYIEGAKAVGLHTILFTSLGQVKRDLIRLGVKVGAQKLRKDF